MSTTQRVFMDDTASKTTTAGGETAVRPKVLRRPAQFSRNSTAEAPLPQTPTVSSTGPNLPPLHQSASTTPWQEDGRFGITLFVIVVLVNAVMALAFSAIPRMHTHVIASDSNNGVAMFGDSALPRPISRDGDSAVTTYADPEAKKRLSTDFDLRNYKPEQNGFSVSPTEIPAPRATALREPAP